MEQYAKIQQILKKEEDQKERKPIYPPTVIQAVFDAKTGASLEAILAQFNSIYVQYQGTPKETRCIIPEEMRRAGLTITYMNMDSETITERAASAVQKDNDHWGLDINWSRVDELSLSGDISVSAQGTWIINGEDTGIKALGPKGDAGLTPWLKTIDNRLHFSYDNVNWEPCSEPIAAYFRFNATSGNTQSGTIGKIQISRDNKTWNDLSPEFTNNLHIAGYVATTAALPANKPVGTIYGVGPTYDSSDTSQTNPIYRIYVYNGTTWVDNGQFTSIAAGIVQETGDSETEVMSQKATTEKLTELESVVGKEKEVANATDETIGNTWQCRVSQSASKGDIINIKIYDASNVLSSARLRIINIDGVQSWLAIPAINEWVTITLDQDITAWSVYAAELTGNTGEIKIFQRGYQQEINEIVYKNDTSLKGIENSIGYKEIPIEILSGKYYAINNNEVVLFDHADYIYTEKSVEKGLYNIYAWARGNASIIVQGVSGKIYNVFNQFAEATNLLVYMPENTGNIYISSAKSKAPKLTISMKEELISLIQNSKSTDVIDESSFIAGGYFSGQTTTIQLGSGRYIEKVPIKGYKSVDIIFPSIATTSWRESMITDTNGNVTQWGYEMNVKSLHFDINFADEYLYVSTSHTTIFVLLNKMTSNDLFVNPLIGLKDKPTFHTSIFNKITCIGDSLTEGVFNTTGSDIIDKRYSYPTFFEKHTGVTTINLGIGSTCASRAELSHSWFDVANNRGYFDANNIGDCCIIALGTNDISRFGEFTGDVSTDIGDSIESCANTSVGGYAAIVLKMKEMQPKMKFFFVTISNNRNQEVERIPSNEKIRQLAEYFGAYIIDLEKWAENTSVESSVFSLKYKNGSHNNALGYNLRARQYAVAMSYLIEHNWKDFQDVQFIGSDYEY